MAKRANLVFCLLALLAVVYMADTAKAQANCKTNKNSTTIADADSVAGYLQGLGDQSCCQTKNAGDFCTQMIASGTARARICGPYRICWDCRVSGNSIALIRAQCEQNGRAAGSFFTGSGEGGLVIEFQLLRNNALHPTSHLDMSIEEVYEGVTK